MTKAKRLLRESASADGKQDIVNDIHRIARAVLDVKDMLEKSAESKDDPEVKKAIAKLHDIDVDVEYLVYQVQHLPKVS